MAMTCSNTALDREFALKLVDTASDRLSIFETIDNQGRSQINMELLTRVVSRFSGYMQTIGKEEDASSLDEFFAYLKNILEYKVSEKNFDSAELEYEELDDEMLLISYDENANDEDTNIIRAFVEDNQDKYFIMKVDNMVYCIRKVPLRLESPQQAALDALKKLSEAPVERRGGFKYLGETNPIEGMISVSADVSSSSFNANVGKIPATLGTAADTLGRDFFEVSTPEGRLLRQVVEQGIDSLTELEKEALLNNYAHNLSLKTIEKLAVEFLAFEQEIKDRWGDDCVIISTEITLVGQREGGQWLNGKPDFLVVDKTGLIHVVDMKTHTAVADTKLSDRDQRHYMKQLYRYIGMLLSYGLIVDTDPMVCLMNSYNNLGTLADGMGKVTTRPESRRIGEFNKQMETIEVKVGDDSFMTLAEYEETHSPDVQINEVNDEGNKDAKDALWLSPQLHRDEENNTIAALLNLQADPELTTDENPAPHPLSFSAQFKITDRGVERINGDNNAKNNMRTPKRRDTRRGNKGLHGAPKLLGETEIRSVANSLACAVSDIIDEIIAGNKIPGLTDRKDIISLKGQPREVVIETLGIQSILEHVTKERIQYIENYPVTWENALERYDEFYLEDTEEDKAAWQETMILNQKNKILLDNQEQLFMAAYAKLSQLEPSVKLVSKQAAAREQAKKEDSLKEEERTRDVGNEEAEQEQESHNEGLTDIEAWMLGERNFSPKASLAEELKRTFGRLVIKDKNGRTIADRYGRNFKEHVDATSAIDTMLSWLQDCESFPEMDKILEAKAEIDPWVRTIREALKKDPDLKKKFFRHFRKDTTIYCRCRARWENGRQIVIKEVLNTRSSFDVMKQSLFTSFENFNVDIFAHNGRDFYIDGEKIRSLKAKLTEVNKELNDIFVKLRKSENFPTEAIAAIRDSHVTAKLSQILQSIGVLGATEEILNSTIAQRMVSSKDNSAKILLARCSGILNSLSTVDSSVKNPKIFEKGSSISGVYHNYKTVLNMIASSVQHHVESSAYNDGKMLYTYTNPSFIGSLIRNLKSDDKSIRYIEDNFLKYKGWFTNQDGTCLNHWLQLLTEGAMATDMREILDYKSELSYNKTKYKDLGSLGYQLSILHEYFGEKGETKKYKGIDGIAWYPLPTMSNKPVSEFVRFIKYNETSKIIEEVLVPTFKQEINRIIDVLEHFGKQGNDSGTMHYDLSTKELSKAFSKEEIETLKDHIKNGALTVKEMEKLSTLTSGAKFHFLYFLGSEFKNDSEFAQSTVNMINSMLREDSVEDAFKMDQNLLEDTLNAHMEAVVEEELKRMEDLGIFEEEKIKDSNGKVRTVLKYAEEFAEHELGGVVRNGNVEAAKKDMKDKLSNFIWNSIAANINIIQLTGVDLAYYGNSVNYQKRIAQIHSPGLWYYNDKDDLDGHSDGYLRSLHISDETSETLVSEMTENAIAALEEYRDTLPESQRADYNNMIKVIRGMFEKFDITDGQSFTSMAGLRKKLSAKGEWNEKMDEAYTRIKNGNFNIDDLGIIWQPTKPFLTAQIPKISGSSTMAIRKVPLQDKNSEYLILLAEALAVGGKKESKLTALFHFMEDTAYGDENTPKKRESGKQYSRYKEKENKHGIDTIHFSSVGKVGVGKVIDISGLSAEEAYNKLHDVVFRKTELTEEQKRLGLDPIYDDSYVDTYEIDRYIEQQEVPIHVTEDHRQLYGSQVRMLGFSDIEASEDEPFIVDGEKMTAQEVIEEAKNLHATNIRESFKELMRELGIDNENISVTEKREKLSAILQEELANDDKYGYDVERACQLTDVWNEKTQQWEKDFVVPLIDPIQSLRIQQLINSIIKKRINKQRIYGGSYVQTTVYDKDLNVVFKDRKGNRLPSFSQWAKQKGYSIDTKEAREKAAKEYRDFVKKEGASIAYYEAYVPMPPILEKFVVNADGTRLRFEDLFDTTDENGNVKKGMLPKEVQQSVSEMIGYRIPTEDKYSMVPIKIAGFLPKAAGQTIMLPKEITLLTGSDFDIDKMYVMMKSFDVQEPSMGSFINYYKSHTNTKLSTEEIAAKLGSYKSGKLENNPEHQQLIKAYNAYRLKHSFTLHSEENAKGRRARRETRNNRLIDLQWAVLTHRDTMSKMFNPGNFNIQKKVGRIIRIMRMQQQDPSIPVKDRYTYQQLSDLFDKKGAQALDAILENSERPIILPSGNIYYQRQNMQGTQMVGIFANHNVSHATCSFQKIGIDMGSRSFYFGGKLIGSTDPENMITLDQIRGFDGKLISKTIAEFLAASVDTAKDPTLSDMNINTFTGSVAMTLARMGFSTEIIGAFLSQPIIMEVSDHYFKMSNQNPYFSGENAVSDMQVKHFKDKETLYDMNVVTSDRGASLTLESLLETLGDAKDSESQQKVLIAFNQLLKLADDVNELTFCTKFNSVKNSAGPSIADTQLKEERVKRFQEKVESGQSFFYLPETTDSEWSNPAQVIANDPILAAFYDSTVNSDSMDVEVGLQGASHKIFNEYFAHYFPGFQAVKDRFIQDYTKTGKISVKTYNRLLNDYLYYLLTYDNGSTVRAVLPYKSEDLHYMLDNIVPFFEKVAARTDREPNLLLDSGLGKNCLYVRKADKYLATDTLVFDSGQLDAEKQDEIKAAWSDLITSEDDELKEFGNILFFYTLQKNGFGFSAKTLMHLASVAVREEAEFTSEEENTEFTPYISGLRSLRDREDTVTGKMINNNVVADSFLDQFVRNHANDYNIVPNIKINETVFFPEEKEVSSGMYKEGSIIIRLDNTDDKTLRDQTLISQDKPFPYILAPRTVVDGDTTKVITEVYALKTTGIGTGMIKGNGIVEMVYERVNKLGITNNFIEYNANSTMEDSVFEELRRLSETEQDLEDTEDDPGADPEEEAPAALIDATDILNNGVLGREFGKATLFTNMENSESKETKRRVFKVMRESHSPDITRAQYLSNIRAGIENALLDQGITSEEKDINDLMDQIEDFCEKKNLC